MDDQQEGRLSTLPGTLKSELRCFTKENYCLLVIEGEPVGKGRPRFTRKGRCCTPEPTRQAEKVVTMASRQQYGQAAPMTGPLAVEMLAISPIPKSWSQKKQAEARTGKIRPARKPDFDNLMKLCCDGLNGVVWEDDKQIVDGRCIKVYGERPAVLMWVWPIAAGTC